MNIFRRLPNILIMKTKLLFRIFQGLSTGLPVNISQLLFLPMNTWITIRTLKQN